MSKYVDYAEYYDFEHPFEEDIPFYLEYAKETGGPILELACGTGRILIPLAKSGYKICGFKIYEKSGYEFGKASIYINMGDVYYQKQKYKKSSQVLEEALKIGRKSNDLAIQTNSLQKLGMILQDQKDFKGATELYSQGLQICQDLGDLVGIATLTNNLGTIEFYGKNYDSALEKYNEAYNILSQIGMGNSPLAQTILRNIEHLN